MTKAQHESMMAKLLEMGYSQEDATKIVTSFEHSRQEDKRIPLEEVLEEFYRVEKPLTHA